MLTSGSRPDRILNVTAHVIFPALLSGGEHSCTALALSITAITFTAICVWLTVRVVNRRERWAKRTLALTILLPVLYIEPI